MKQNKEVKISYLAAHFTTIVSVTLLLLIVGIIAIITVSAAKESRRLRENLQVSVVMADSVSNESTAGLAKYIQGRPYAMSVGVITREVALENWKKDTGEDLEVLFGVNPLSPEVNFHVRAEYSSAVSLDSIKASLGKLPGVEAVATPDSTMVENMNRNINLMSIVLGVIAVVMIVISFVLINNTVHLSVYARRFTIHTMQLVGATDGFIRRPYIVNNMLAGLIAGVVASVVLGIALVAAPSGGETDIASYVGWDVYAIISSGMIATGVLVCGIAAYIATTRHLRRDYEDLFK